MKHGNKFLLAFACLLLLGVAGAAVADTATGSVILEEQSFSATVITAPVLVDPTAVVQYVFEVSANLPLGSYGAGLVGIHLLLYHDSILDPMNEPASENNIKVHFDDTGYWTEGANLIDSSADVFADILSSMSYQGFVDIQYPSNSLANVWHCRLVAEMDDAELVYSAISDFSVSSYLAMNLLSASFDFGAIAVGSVQMPIQLVDGVAQSWLEVEISSNYEVMIELGITHFFFETYSISYYYFSHNSVDDASTAGQCTEGPSTTTPLANLAPVLGDSVIVKIYIFVSPQNSLPDGLYTGVLTVVAT